MAKLSDIQKWVQNCGCHCCKNLGRIVDQLIENKAGEWWELHAADISSLSLVPGYWWPACYSLSIMSTIWAAARGAFTTL